VRTIGIIGGMSWESSAQYYRLLNQGVAAELGGLHSAPCILYSVDFAAIERLQRSGDWDDAGDILAAAARSLELAGAQILLLGTNTMHKVAASIEEAVSIPFLHIADVTAAAVNEAGLELVGLIGTAFTMEQRFLRDRLATRGVEVVVPEAPDRALIHRVIYEELCRGVIRDESRGVVQMAIERLIASGAQGVILGCTELELLIGANDVAVPLFATTQLHVTAAIAAALAP
jgi:aspartate racemase